MTNPTSEQVQLKIAEVMGCCLCSHYGEKPGRVFSREKGERCRRCKKLMPENWPGDRNASRELIKGMTFKARFYEAKSAYQECMLYLEREGWRWEVCEACGGTGGSTGPDGESDGCPKCYPGTEGGQWERVG